MSTSILESRRWKGEQGSEMLDVLAQSDTPALATDIGGHIVFWNRAAERLLGRPTNQVLGRRCYDVLRGKDVFGNRFCQENCCVMSMSRREEPVQSFEITVGSVPQNEQALHVTVLKVPGERPELGTLVHIFHPIDREARLARALEQIGAQRPGNGHKSWEPVTTHGPVALPEAPPLTQREKEILRWVAAGLQNKEIAQKLGISLATVRNHIHNILEKLDVHSKLEAVSLAFRQGWVQGPNGELEFGSEPFARP